MLYSKVSPFTCSSILFVFWASHLCNGMSLLGNHKPQYYSPGETIYAEVNSITSIYTLLPWDYYSLPFCKPSSGVWSSWENLGQLLMGEKIQNSPRFRVNTNESVYPNLRSPGKEVLQIQKMGFPVAYHGFPFYVYYIINHLKFRVFIHETKIREKPYYEMVGFEVAPYEVEFIPSNKTWQSRWEAYLKKGRQEVQFYSIINSVISILVVAGLTSFKIWRKLAKSRESLPLTNDGISRSKLFLEVAFRESSCSKILCIMVGTGIQISGSAIVTVAFAALGFMLPGSGDILFCKQSRQPPSYSQWSSEPASEEAPTSERRTPPQLSIPGIRGTCPSRTAA